MRIVPAGVSVLVLSFLLLTVGLAHPPQARADGGGGLDEATKLREASATDWNAGRYTEAATKLQRAAEIYLALPGDHSADLAVVYRALVYNLMATALREEALRTFELLMDLAGRVPAVEGELTSAYLAFYDAAKAQRSLEDRRATLEPLRAAAVDRDSDKLGAQIVHDLAGMTREAGKVPEAVDLYEAAIAERHRIGDLLGKAWSLNNLANMLLEEGLVDEALLPLLEAYRLVHEEQVVIPQASIAVNLRTALRQLQERPAAQNEHARWLWKLAEIGAASDVPEVIPSDELLRQAAALTARLADRRSAYEAAKHLNEVELLGVPPEIQAQQKLAAARMAIDAGKPADADEWLGKVDVGGGLCATHLAARVHTLRAVAAALRKRKKEFDEEARQAAEAWAQVSDREGQEAALAKLALLGTKIQAASASELQAAYQDLRRQGKPGGLGGMASGGGDRSGYPDLGWSDPLFEIEALDGAIVIRDVCAKHETRVEVRWQPRSVALNGLSLTVFGGWIRIDGLSYGGGASAGGQPGTATVEDLGAVLPVPGDGKLVILKNGAVTYRGD